MMMSARCSFHKKRKTDVDTKKKRRRKKNKEEKMLGKKPEST